VYFLGISEAPQFFNGQKYVKYTPYVYKVNSKALVSRGLGH
jgi:hypothetical protein